ncbi:MULTISPECIES: YjiG family protein [unclassified Cetobacterium]|uniref:YjiG family protein n=1 Tax=unclassified Cetobacterium TaxID=2630983 RepID=UPI0012E0257F|nr:MULTISPECIES: YjiG family protein [unclassified Cetobacterium]
MKKNIFDYFIEGCRKGFDIGINSIIPNVMMAFIIIKILQVTNLLEHIGKVFGPIMGIFGLPGETITVLLSAWLSMAGGVGVLIGLFDLGIVGQKEITIIFPAIALMGAQIQYMGRLLGPIGIRANDYLIFFGISIFNASLAMLIMKVLL